MYTPMLDWYRGECMVSRVSINNGMQELTYGMHAPFSLISMTQFVEFLDIVWAVSACVMWKQVHRSTYPSLKKEQNCMRSMNSCIR